MYKIQDNVSILTHVKLVCDLTIYNDDLGEGNLNGQHS